MPPAISSEMPGPGNARVGFGVSRLRGRPRNPATSRPRNLILERHCLVLVDDVRAGRGAAALAGAGVSAAAGAAAAAFVAAAVEHLHVARDDLGAVLLLARLLVVPAIGADGAFDVDQLPLAEVLAADLAEAGPGDDVVPLGALLLFAALVGEALVGGEGEFGDGLAAGGGAHFGVFSEAPNEDDFIDHVLSPVSWSRSDEAWTLDTSVGERL